jgi:hypothetical protein
MFVNTCSEKWVIAQRVALELANLHPRPPSVRLFDAGVGDGTVLARVLRAMHSRFRWMPFYVVAKEISLEDVRLTLEKMPDRFHEHPATVLVMTNLNYAEAPWLTPSSITAATGMVWHELALQGDSAADFDAQITALAPFLGQNWRASVSRKSGNPVYEKPVVLVIYREDQRFLLHEALPRRGAGRADCDLVIASQPYRARASVEFKARRVLAPLARAGARRAADRHPLQWRRSRHRDRAAGLARRKSIHIRSPHAAEGHQGRARRARGKIQPQRLRRLALAVPLRDAHAAERDRPRRRLDRHLNAVRRVERRNLRGADRRRAARGSHERPRYLDATRAVLREHKGLWFRDESFVISRKRDV